MTKSPLDKEESAKELEESLKELQQIMIEDLAHADLEPIIKSLYALRKFSMAGKHNRTTLLGKTYKDISRYKDALHFEIQKRLKDNPDGERIRAQIARDLSVYL